MSSDGGQDTSIDSQRLQNIKQALLNQDLTPNQRKKYRKKLSRLFHGGSSQGQVSEMSSLQGGSACTGQASAAAAHSALSHFPLHSNSLNMLGPSQAHAGGQDMSSFMRMIASELKTMDPQPPAASLLTSTSVATTSQSLWSRGASAAICRHDLSYSMSVISIELDQGVDQLLVEEGGEPAGQEPLHKSKVDSMRDGKMKKRKRVFSHGNYHNYYGYRTLGDLSSDPRLSKLDPSWFRGKILLDVGCNEGLVTLALSRFFCCKKALGVDIDETLVHRAMGNLSSMKADLSQKLKEGIRRGRERGQASGPRTDGNENADIRGALKALSKTTFKTMDWSKGRAKGEIYEVITCLSVTKWIHLNGGDVALKRFFQKLHDSLVPDGLLILEPQPWRSYKAALSKQRPLKSIKDGEDAEEAMLPSGSLCSMEDLEMRPEMFLDHLTAKVGFKLVVELNQGKTGQKFDRPFYVLKKSNEAA